MQQLPAFSGRCRARDLHRTAARRAAQAGYLRRWHAANPQAPQQAEQGIGRMLLGMALVLAVAFAYAWLTHSLRPH